MLSTARWLCSGPTVLTSSCHELATAGTRMFGDFFGGKSPIKVRIYDFALYFDAKQVRTFARRCRGEGTAAAEMLRGLRHACRPFYVKDHLWYFACRM